jgi:outer membrane usher protein
MDVTAARTTFDDGRDDATGLSWRAQYSKDIPATDTTVTLASYRYSTSGFYTFQEAIDQRDSQIDDGIYTYRRTNTRRSRLQINLSQRLGAWGSAYMNTYQQDYWDLPGTERSVGAGFSSSWRDISWSVSYSLTRTPDADSDCQVAFSVNIPFSHFLPHSWATYSVNSASGGYVSHQAGIGGTALENNNLSYNLQQSWTGNNTGYGASLSGRYRGHRAKRGSDTATAVITSAGTTALRVQLSRMSTALRLGNPCAMRLPLCIFLTAATSAFRTGAGSRPIASATPLCRRSRRIAITSFR